MERVNLIIKDIQNFKDTVVFVIQCGDEEIIANLNRYWCEDVGTDIVMDYLKDICERHMNRNDVNNNYNMVIGKEL